MPIGANEQLEELRLLAMDLAAHHGCERLRGKLVPVGGSAEQPAQGRMWVRDCSASVEGEQLALDVDALLWTWVDRRSRAVGATFRVDQYVGLEAQVDMRTVPQLRYDRDRRQALLWLEPVREPDVRVETVGGVDARAGGLWSETVAFGAGLFGASPDARAARQVQTRGGQRLERRVDQGLTVGVDLCTRRTVAELGHLTRMPEPAHPARGLPGRSTDQRVRPTGLDAAGPFSRPVKVRIVDGAPLRARLVCAETAHRMIEAFVRRGLEAVPAVEPLVDTKLEPGRTRTLSREGARCEAVLIGTVAEGASASTTFSYAPEDRPAAPLVAGCEDAG